MSSSPKSHANSAPRPSADDRWSKVSIPSGIGIQGFTQVLNKRRIQDSIVAVRPLRIGARYCSNEFRQELKRMSDESLGDLIDQGPRKKIVLLVQDQKRCTQSYSWRIWSGGTSFFVKPRYNPVAGFKVSLHGPRSGVTAVWKVQMDWRDRDRAVAAGGVALFHGSDYREEFHGRKVAPGVRHAVRIRHPWTVESPIVV